MPRPPRLVTVGSVALDTLSTPHGRRVRTLGGAAVHASVAASFFVPGPGLVGVVGEDFTASHRRPLLARGVDLGGLTRAPGRTFHWEGSYAGDMASATTHKTELGVFGTFDPVVPSAWRSAPFLFLANIEPSIQGKVLDQMRPRFSLLDTMNLWIGTRRAALLKVVARVDALVLNDAEIRQLTGEASLARAVRACLGLGPKYVVLKRGEHGASLARKGGWIHVPAFPTADVVDPTGAGDSFAGAFMGVLARRGKVDPAGLRLALATGAVVSSFQVEGFSLERTVRLTSSQIARRLGALRGMARF